jgi:hypothetical protein
MKPVKVLIYLVVLVILGSYVYLVEIKHKDKVQQAEQQAKKMVHLDKDKILKVELIAGDRTKVKIEKPSGTWVLSVPVKTKADNAAVDSLLHALVESEPEKVVREKDVTWDEYGLDKPEFTVAFSTADKSFKLSFGGSNPAKTSYYLRVDDEPKLFLVADTLKNSLNKSAFDLREKSVFGLAETDVNRIVVSGKGNEIELARKDPSKWVASKPESFPVKQALLMTNLRTLTNLKAKEIIDEPSKEGDPYGLDKPEESIVLSGPKLEQTLIVGKAVEKKEVASKEPDRYARLKGDETVYVIDGRNLKGLKTDPSELRDRSLLSFNPAEIERFEIEIDGKQWAAAQNKEKTWTIEKPEKKTNADAWTVTGVLWDLKDLEWKSLTKPIPENLGPLDLDKPGLVVSIFKKDDKQPITLKVGWKAVPSESKEPAKDKKPPEGKQPAAEGRPQGAEHAQEQPTPPGKSAESSQGIPDAPATLNALAEPAEEQGAVFVLDGSFLTRLRGDLQRWTATDKK